MKEFNPYSAPKTKIAHGPHAGDEEGIWCDDELLIMTKNAELPDRCLKCNLPADCWKIERKLRWHKPFWYLLVLLNLFLYVLVAMLVHKTAKLRIPLCERHRRRRRLRIVSAWRLVLAGVVTILVAIIVLSSSPDTGIAVPVICSGGVLLLVGMIMGIVGSEVATVQKIDERFVWLTKVAPEFLAELPPWHTEMPVDNGLNW